MKIKHIFINTYIISKNDIFNMRVFSIIMQRLSFILFEIVKLYLLDFMFESYKSYLSIYIFT